MAGTNIGGVSVSVSLSVDQALKELDKLEKKLHDTFSGMQTANGAKPRVKVPGLTDTTKDLKKTTTAATGLKTAFGDLGQSAMLARSNPMMAASRAASSLSSAFSGVTSAAGASTVALAAVGVAAVAATIALVSAGVGVYKLGKLGFGASRELEVLNLSMEAITGSTAAAKREVAALQQIAIESPFLTTSIVNLDKFLMSQGVASGKLRQGLTKSVLDLSAALGLTDDNLGSITYALAQVQARGYLSGDEMRQLANQFIPVMEALKTIPKYSTMSSSAIRKMIEQGQISSTQFFEALIAYTSKYDGIAVRASMTVEGLLNKLEDVSRIKLGQAFIDVENLSDAISPLAAIRDLLSSVVEMIERIDWRPFAAALGQLTAVFTGPLGSLFSNGKGDWLVKFFTEWLPAGILWTAKVLMYLREIWLALYRVMTTFVYAIGDAFNAVVDLLKAFGITWGDVFKIVGLIAASFVLSLAVVFSAAIAQIGMLAGAATMLISVFRALAAAMRFDWADVVRSWNAGVTGAQNVVRGFGNTLKALPKTVLSSVDAIDDLVNAFRRIQKIKLPQLPDLAGSGDFADLAGGLDSGAVGGADGGGGSRRAAKSIDEIAKIMDMLWDLTRRWREMRSDLEKGFLGKEGFSATIDEIWKMGQKLDEAMVGLGRVDVADWLYDETTKLVALAEKRDELTETLKSANKNLESLINERDKYTQKLRESAIKFAAAMETEYETVTRWEQQSDRGFFYESEEKQAKDLVTTLEERSRALKAYYENMKKLSDAGLDKNLLEDLLTAGPEASGETAAALVEGGQEMINSVNVIYKDIEKTADLIGEFGAEEFHDSGIEQAEGLVAGLQSQLETITSAAEEITEEIYNAILPFAAEMEKAGASGSKGMAKGLSSGVPSVSGAMGEIGGAVSGGWARMDDEATRGASKMLDTFRLELKVPWLADLTEMSETSIDKIDSMVDSINDSLERIKLPELDLGESLNMDWSSITELASSLRENWKTILRKALFDIPFTAWQFVPGLKDLYNWATRGGRMSGGGSRRGYSGVSVAALSRSINTNAAGVTGQAAYFGANDTAFAAPVIKVYIGDQELRGIVRTEVVYNDRREMSRVVAGRSV